MVYEDFMPRIGLSLFMEFGVGLERQLTGHASGIRIYAPISFSCCFPSCSGWRCLCRGQGAYPSCRMKDMPASEKAGFRIRPLCRNIGGMIALCGIVFWTGGVEAFRSGSFVRRMTACLALAGLDAGHIGKADAARAAPYAAPT